MTEKHFILATAGHVDHGKSALVKAFTGTDPDRLPEEKARGITIDLGFAELNLTGPNGEKLSVVWMPGKRLRLDFVDCGPVVVTKVFPAQKATHIEMDYETRSTSQNSE